MTRTAKQYSIWTECCLLKSISTQWNENGWSHREMDDGMKPHVDNNNYTNNLERIYAFLSQRNLSNASNWSVVVLFFQFLFEVIKSMAISRYQRHTHQNRHTQFTAAQSAADYNESIMTWHFCLCSSLDIKSSPSSSFTFDDSIKRWNLMDARKFSWFFSPLSRIILSRHRNWSALFVF